MKSISNNIGQLGKLKLAKVSIIRQTGVESKSTFADLFNSDKSISDNTNIISPLKIKAKLFNSNKSEVASGNIEPLLSNHKLSKSENTIVADNSHKFETDDFAEKDSKDIETLTIQSQFLKLNLGKFSKEKTLSQLESDSNILSDKNYQTALEESGLPLYERANSESPMVKIHSDSKTLQTGLQINQKSSEEHHLYNEKVKIAPTEEVKVHDEAPKVLPEKKISVPQTRLTGKPTSEIKQASNSIKSNIDQNFDSGVRSNIISPENKSPIDLKNTIPEKMNVFLQKQHSEKPSMVSSGINHDSNSIKSNINQKLVPGVNKNIISAEKKSPIDLKNTISEKMNVFPQKQHAEKPVVVLSNIKQPSSEIKQNSNSIKSNIDQNFDSGVRSNTISTEEKPAIDLKNIFSEKENVAPQNQHDEKPVVFLSDIKQPSFEIKQASNSIKSNIDQNIFSGVKKNIMFAEKNLAKGFKNIISEKKVDIHQTHRAEKPSMALSDLEKSGTPFSTNVNSQNSTSIKDAPTNKNNNIVISDTRIKFKSSNFLNPNAGSILIKSNGLNQSQKSNNLNLKIETNELKNTSKTVSEDFNHFNKTISTKLNYNIFNQKEKVVELPVNPGFEEQLNTKNNGNSGTVLKNVTSIPIINVGKDKKDLLNLSKSTTILEKSSDSTSSFEVQPTKQNDEKFSISDYLNKQNIFTIPNSNNRSEKINRQVKFDMPVKAGNDNILKLHNNQPKAEQKNGEKIDEVTSQIKIEHNTGNVENFLNGNSGADKKLNISANIPQANDNSLNTKTMPHLFVNDIPAFVTNKIEQFTGNVISSAQLNLKPESLGTLIVEISVKNNIANVSFSADSKEAMTAIESQMPLLKEKLAQQGLQSDRIEIKLKDNNDVLNQKNLNEQKNQSQEEQKSRKDFIKSFAYLRNGNYESKNMNYNYNLYNQMFLNKYSVL